MRFVALLDEGPAAGGRPLREQDAGIMRAHLLSMRRLYDEGRVLFGGPYRSVFSGIVLIEAGDLDEARRIMEADPAVAARIMSFRLHGVRAYFDAVSGIAWSPPEPDPVSLAATARRPG